MSDARCVAIGCDDGPDLDGQPGPRMAKEGLLCAKHYGRLEQTVSELPTIYDWIGANLASGGGGGFGDYTTGTKDRPLPVKASVVDLQAEMAAVVLSWVRLVCEERGLHGPDRGDIHSTAGYLGHQLEWACEQAWVDDLVAEVGDLAQQAHHLAPWRPARHHLPEPCPNPDCARPGLVRYDGASEVQCSECGERWSEDDYRWLAGLLASDARQRLGPSCEECQHQSCWELRAVVETIGIRRAS